MFGRRKKQLNSRSPSTGVSKGLSGRLFALFNRSGADDSFFDDLEDLLVEADFGAASSVEVVDELRSLNKNRSEKWTKESLIEALKDIIRPSLKVADITPSSDSLSLYLVLGVNGVGKTTSIAKMAHRYLQDGLGPVILAAGDTFRAAAIEQLEIHGSRVGARVVKQDHGSDPGAVVYDAINSAKSRGDKIIIADTAGRMHNRANLVKELTKIDRIARERLGDDAVYRKLLVIDATTGQNGLRQAETFHEAVGVDAIVLTKYDSSAKGGLIAAIGKKLGLPIAFVGKGEGMNDLLVFNPDVYLDELLQSAGSASTPATGKSVDKAESI